MRRKSQIIEIILFSLLISASTAFEEEELSINGSNSSEYWVYKKDYQEHLENRLLIDLSYKGFFGRIGYFMWEISDPAVSIKYPIFSLGYSTSPINIVIGHYYATFGRGLVLREYLDEEFKHDKSLIGLKIEAELSPISVTLLSGRPRNLLFRGELTPVIDTLLDTSYRSGQFVYEFANDTTDILRGASLSLTPTKKVSFGGSYLRFMSKSDIAPCAFTELIGGNLGCSIRDWDSYIEYAQQLKCTAAQGRIRGEGIYLSISGNLTGVGVTAQYSNYRDLGAGGSDYRYNDPPTPIRSGLSINRGLDEWGGSTMISTSLNPSLYFEAEYGFLENHDRTKWAGEWYGDMKYDVSENLSFSLGGERRNKKEIEPGIIKLDTRPRVDILYYLLSGDGIEIEFSHGFIHEKEWLRGTEKWQQINYVERSLLLSYSHSPQFSTTLRVEHRSKQVKRLSPKTLWFSTEAAIDIQPNLTLRLIAGSVKGSLVCSGGVCLFEPDFEGVKASLSYMF